jgi:N-acetylneuraminic acid mutarotase
MKSPPSIDMTAPYPAVENDLHAYDPVSMTWFNLTSYALGSPPGARIGHGFTSEGGKLYVHGGRDPRGMRGGHFVHRIKPLAVRAR